MKRLVVLALCLHLSQELPPAQKDVLAALKDQQIPLYAQVLSGEPLVNYVNNNQELFRAELAPPTASLEKKLMKSKFLNQNRKPIVNDELDTAADIPKSFDARTQWPDCPSLEYIRDQANCAERMLHDFEGCGGYLLHERSHVAKVNREKIQELGWEVLPHPPYSTDLAPSDYLLFRALMQHFEVELSADDILSCCDECGFGCDGGWPQNAWDFFVVQGVVSGGVYGTKDACRPYEIQPCGHHQNKTHIPECHGDAETPKCRKKCQKGYNVPYKKDKVHGRRRIPGKTSYQLPNSAKSIQRDIIKYGPVVAAFTVYEDFMHYKSGIYKP
ncbi:unnamed protein product [Heligmosomoides polygyrus]|uniref:Pept_C1 domain-containing protein n=1 Tax=Heligmosomoides polygyrus TaxID=6339 RepID=A0A183GN22_HELPZ|nr:unnamed protein product [Heligmosomoides polygyrus]